MRKYFHTQHQASPSQHSREKKKKKKALFRLSAKDHNATIHSGCALSFPAFLYLPWNISFSVSCILAENISVSGGETPPCTSATLRWYYALIMGGGVRVNIASASWGCNNPNAFCFSWMRETSSASHNDRCWGCGKGTKSQAVND